MTFITTISSTTKSYLVEFEDSSISIVESKDLDNTAATTGSTVKGKYNATLVASGK